MTYQTALGSVRVLDFTRVLAGPYCTRIMADFGAEVIKVQPMLPEAEDEFSRGYYNTWNRNKLGVTLNLSQPQAIALVKRLVAVSDIVVENFSPRVMASWELDYQKLKRIKPDIIMLSISSMGQTGPQRNYAGFGPTAHAFSAMTYLTSYPGAGPVGPGFSYADHAAGLFGALAVLGALEYRERTGKGQYIDLSLVEAMSSLLGKAILQQDISGMDIPPQGNSSEQAVPHGIYRCRGKDRWCAITVTNDDQWLGFKQALDGAVRVHDERFATRNGRLVNRNELDRLVEAWTSGHTVREVILALRARSVPCGPVQDAHDLARDPQLKARGFFIEMEDNEGNEILADASPVRLSETPARYIRPAPPHGRDNDFVYRQILGLSEEELTSLRELEII